jgi:hypothetical protein
MTSSHHSDQRVSADAETLLVLLLPSPKATTCTAAVNVQGIHDTHISRVKLCTRDHAF